jgi:hypothetical protein
VRYSSLILVSLILSACESAHKITSYLEPATPITLTAKQISSVRAGVMKNLKDHDLELVSIGRMRAGRASTGVIVCGYVKSKKGSGDSMDEKPFQGIFLGPDNASDFVVTGTGGAGDDAAATLEVCRRSGLELAPS